MKRIFILVLFLFSVGKTWAQNTATWTVTSTFTNTATWTPTSTYTKLPTRTFTPTATTTATNTATRTASNTPTNTPTPTASNTKTPTPTLTPQGYRPGPASENTLYNGLINPSGIPYLSSGIIMIQPTPTNSPTATPTGSFTPTPLPTATPQVVYVGCSSVTVVTNLSALQSGFVLVNCPNTGSRMGYTVYTAGNIQSQNATATPIWVVQPAALNGTAHYAGQINGGGISRAFDSGGVVVVPNLWSTTSSSSYDVCNSFGIEMQSAVNLATITPTALPMTVIAGMCP